MNKQKLLDKIDCLSKNIRRNVWSDADEIAKVDNMDSDLQGYLVDSFKTIVESFEEILTIMKEILAN